MAKKTLYSKTYNHAGSLHTPTPDHFVHFYKSENDLMDPLTTYIGSGLKNGDICIVIATQTHVHKLNEQLEESGIDVQAAIKNGQYITLNASNALAKFMKDDVPDKKLFFESVGAVAEAAANRHKPIRAYGEMVAQLWKVGNKEAVMSLESLWNDLSLKYSFSLYCAYPDLHFVMDPGVQDEITEHHNVSLEAYALA